MTTTLVSSCSLAGWNQYGKRFVRSFIDYWPLETHLYLISEDHIPLRDMGPNVQLDRVHVIPLNNYQPAAQFYERHKDNPRVKGGRRHYDFRLDAWKFSKKVFAIRMVQRAIGKGRLWWLDADTFTLKSIPSEFLATLPPAGYSLAYLGRRKYHSECGFVAYNLDMSITHDFLASFEDVYTSDTFLNLKEWHDSWIFDWVRKANPTLPCYTIPYTYEGHPFNFSVLGEYMDHLKGGRKKLGISTEHPRFKSRK